MIILSYVFVIFIGFVFGIAGAYNLITKRKYFFWNGKKYIIKEAKNG